MLFLFVPRDSIGNHSDEAGSGAVAKTHRREPAGKNACESPYETRARQRRPPLRGLSRIILPRRPVSLHSPPPLLSPRSPAHAPIN